MPGLASDLAAALSTVHRPGDFVTCGRADLAPPVLEVEGVGPVALPLLPVQAEDLIAAAERAPYGRGPSTLLDTDVRRTWQMDASRVRLAGRAWSSTLDAIVARAAAGLGVEGPVEAQFYKLLLYAGGDFFLPHRDTEKAPGMFASLVIVLPSAAAGTGGALIVRHKDREERLDLVPDDPAELRFAAFYADCVHEVTPVASGHRLTLIYNLIRPGTGRLPLAPDHTEQAAAIAALLRNWSADDDAPVKLIVPMEHAYTSAELGPDALKGADAAAAGVLTAAAAASACALHLALVEIEESGIADYADDGGSYRWRRSEPEFEVVEVTDWARRLTQWRRSDGGAAALADLPFEPEELVPPGSVDNLEPDEEHFHEATGNEGASFERTYRRAAFVLWPEQRFLAVLAQGGLPVTLPRLEVLAHRWAAQSSEDRGASQSVWKEAHELAGLMTEAWTDCWWSGGEDEKPHDASRILAALMRLDDRERIAGFLTRLAEVGGFGAGDIPAMVEAALVLGPEHATMLIDRIVARRAAGSLPLCAQLLACATGCLPTAAHRHLASAGRTLLSALPPQPAPESIDEPASWNAPLRMTAQTAAAVVLALARIDDELAGRAVGHTLAHPKIFGMDRVVVPAAVILAETAPSSVAGGRLRTAALAHLKARIAIPLEPPADERRPSDLSCQCPDCRDLARFLADPVERRWRLKAAEPKRAHIQYTITRANADVDCLTERRGRPYTLICTKNRASYARRQAQRRQDLENAARLEA